VKEQRKGLGRVGGLAESAVAGMRRRQQSRAPRVVVYDAAGHSRLLPPESPEHDELLDAAERVLEAVGDE
jgi:hypothetical protein